MRRPLLLALLICALVGTVVGVLVIVDLTRGSKPKRDSRQPAYQVPILDVAPGSAVPYLPAAAPAGEVLAKLARATDIPERTLRAYAAAQARMATQEPGCGLTWATLAGVGRIETHHGRFGGTDIGDDGTLTPPIIGLPLDGSPGRRAIRDTDGGRLDGDQQWDRAVGAMQFLPATWERWAMRASADGQRPDPQNVDDAAVTAARYLCASGPTLTTGSGWWQAVMTYNRSTAYARDVFSAADAYARTAATLA